MGFLWTDESSVSLAFFSSLFEVVLKLSERYKALTLPLKKVLLELSGFLYL